MKNITIDTVYNMVNEHKDNLCYNLQYIQEIQLDNEEGETEATLELYIATDGYIYSIYFTDETTGKSKEFIGTEADKLATKLLQNGLIELTI